MTLIVTWLWQGLAIAWITAAAVGTMPRLNAATRHAIWWLALAAVLVLPVAHGLAAITATTPGASDLTPLDVGAAGALMVPALPNFVIVCAAVLWAMTAAIGMLRIAGSCRALGRLKRAASPFDGSREGRLPLWLAARAGGHRAAELRTSDCTTGACALGFGRPVILISRSVAAVLGDESLDEIVMHEQAHLDRYDDWSQLLLAVVLSLAGLHPAVRFLARRLDVDREAACDDRVVSSTLAARRYASSLLAVAAASNPETRLEFTVGVPTATTTPSALRVRIVRLLDTRRDRSARLASATVLASVTALALAVVTSMQVGAAVIFLETAADSAPAAAVAPASERRGGAEPAPRTNVNAMGDGRRTPPRRPPTTAERSAPSAPAEAAARPVAGTVQEPSFAAPLERRTIAASDTIEPVLAVSLPPSSPGEGGLASTLASKPWEAVSVAATSAAGDLARTALATGDRARNAGISIGRLVTRARKAGASIF